VQTYKVRATSASLACEAKYADQFQTYLQIL